MHPDGFNSWSDELWELDLQPLLACFEDHHHQVTLSWKLLRPHGQVPPPRAAHSMSVVANGAGVVVFGGRTPDGRQNDVHYLHLSSLTWTKWLQPSGAAQPPGRSWHVAVPCGDWALLVHGGMGPGPAGDNEATLGGDKLGDWWMLDLHTRRWHNVTAMPLDESSAASADAWPNRPRYWSAGSVVHSDQTCTIALEYGG